MQQNPRRFRDVFSADTSSENDRTALFAARGRRQQGTGSGDLFKEEAGQKPARREIQADQAVDIKGSPAVVPGADPGPAQKKSSDIFDKKDQNHVVDPVAPYLIPVLQRMEVSQPAVKPPPDRAQKCPHSRDREHNQGGSAHEAQISCCNRLDGSKNDFHTPSGNPAFYKIPYKSVSFLCSFHMPIVA